MTIGSDLPIRRATSPAFHLVVVALVLSAASNRSLEARPMGLATPWEVWCCGSADCFPAHHYYADQLHHAGRWLGATGFNGLDMTVPADLDEEARALCNAPPDTASDETQRLVAFVHDELLDNHGSDRYGCDAAVEAAYAPSVSAMFLRSTTYLEAQGLDWNDPADRARARTLYAPTHELFHAVQNYYKPYGQRSPGWDQQRKWIWEGTALAVQAAYADQFMAPMGQRPPNARPFRQYDVPLHEPVDDPDPCTPGSRADSYGTFDFWLKIGRRIGSAHSIAYFENILEQDLDAENGLEGVDTALSTLNQPRGGLYDLLPWYFSTLEIHRQYFGHPEFLSAVLPSGRSREELHFPGNVRKVAGNAADLEVRHSSDQSVEVEITFKDENENLHLIVDGHPFNIGGPGTRNLYRDVIVHGNQKRYDIVVANVKKEAVESEDLDYELQVNLREIDYCSMTARVSGDVGGSFFGDIAHFSTKGGATIYGAFSNPEMIAGVADWLGDMAAMAGGEGADEEIEATKQEWLAEMAEGEIPRESFGLSLSNQRLDDEGEEAMAFLAGGFTLEASVIGPEVGEGVTGNIPLKMLRVVPGPRAESTLDKVPFVWVEGAPGSAQLFITRNTGHLVSGRISGTLYAEGYYKTDGKAPVITVNASFVALEGPVGCMGPGVELPF